LLISPVANFQFGEIILNKLAVPWPNLIAAFQNASANQCWNHDHRFQKPATVSRNASEFRTLTNFHQAGNSRR
jgi:endonuclease I